MISDPASLEDVRFDHEAAFRATRAIDDAIAALDDVTDQRSRLARDILDCFCTGPYADSLRADVAAAAREAEWLVGELVRARSLIASAREDAWADQARREVGRAHYRAELEAAARAWADGAAR